jgi:Na+-transporting NADH:ubiquinone oxidoreductase subunit D
MVSEWIGYGWILVVVGFFRELLGSGTLLGYQVVPQALYDAGYENNGLMMLAPMAILLGGLYHMDTTVEGERNYRRGTN